MDGCQKKREPTIERDDNVCVETEGRFARRTGVSVSKQMKPESTVDLNICDKDTNVYAHIFRPRRQRIRTHQDLLGSQNNYPLTVNGGTVKRFFTDGIRGLPESS